MFTVQLWIQAAGSRHSPALPHRACTSPAVPVLSGSSEVRTQVWAPLTILHTLRRWPPYLLRDGFRLGCTTTLHSPHSFRICGYYSSHCSDPQFCEAHTWPQDISKQYARQPALLISGRDHEQGFSSTGHVLHSRVRHFALHLRVPHLCRVCSTVTFTVQKEPKPTTEQPLPQAASCLHKHVLYKQVTSWSFLHDTQQLQ